MPVRKVLVHNIWNSCFHISGGIAVLLFKTINFHRCFLFAV